MYTCPICGYNELPHPPEDWTICPSCLTEFGYSDENWGVDELRREWIQAGATWGSTEINPPEYWSPIEQLRNVDYEVSDEDKIAIASMADDNIVVLFKLEREMDLPQEVVIHSVSLLGDQQSLVIKLPDEGRVQRQSPSADVLEIAWLPT